MNMDRLPIIAIVVPCYNEEEMLPISAPRILSLLDRMAGEQLVDASSFVLFSNDGSRDKTWEIIESLHQKDSRYKGISLAHNRGHQFALLAGLMTAMPLCDATVSIDADLQDDLEAVVEMVQDYAKGSDIVYGVRESRESDTWFKRTTARGFYKFQKAMGLETVYDHADFRLLDRRALELLSEYGESNLFLRGIIPQLGLKSSVVKYDRKAREAGESKYPLSKMLSFSIDGITSFSARPMRIIFLTGLLFLILDVAVWIYVFISFFLIGSISGWASLMLSVWFLGSLMLMGLGIVGEYIGKIFIEVKNRPRYAVSDKLID